MRLQTSESPKMKKTASIGRPKASVGRVTNVLIDTKSQYETKL